MIKLNVFQNNHGVNLQNVEIKHTVFKGGEVNVCIPELARSRISSPFVESVVITAVINSSDDLMALLLTVDAIRRQNSEAAIALKMPYFPYARQDRVCNPGEALSVAVMANLINSLNFTSVVITDPHSDVTPALIKNVSVTNMNYLFNLAIVHGDIPVKEMIAFAPDQGAYKKVLGLAKKHEFMGFGYANKKRNPKTMEIEGLEIYGDVTGKDILIIDDICDGGRTFIELAKKLKEAGANRVELYVTHGIFSYGIKIITDHVDHIYTTNSFIGDRTFDSDEIKNVTCIPVL